VEKGAKNMTKPVKLVYLSIDGQERVENWRPRARMIEEPDGYHPATNDSIWQHDSRRFQPRTVIIQGVTPPLGAHMAHEDMGNMLTEKLLAEHGFRKPPVSKMFWRALSNAADWLMKYGLMVGVVFLILGAIAYSYLGGG
jgi:hypothetical protein